MRASKLTVRDLHVCVPLRLRLVDVVEEPERVDAVWEGRAALDQARIDSLLQVFVRLAGARLGALGEALVRTSRLGTLGATLEVTAEPRKVEVNAVIGRMCRWEWEGCACGYDS